eukprot:766583-Hanusia_phi.AAC.9
MEVGLRRFKGELISLSGIVGIPGTAVIGSPGDNGNDGASCAPGDNGENGAPGTPGTDGSPGAAGHCMTRAVTEHQGTTEIQGFLAFRWMTRECEREELDGKTGNRWKRCQSQGFVVQGQAKEAGRLSPQEHFGGWCYTPRQEARTFEEAEHVCRAWGGHVFRYAGTCSCHLLVLISPPPASSRWMRWRWRCGSSDTLTSGSASGGCPRLVSDGRRGQHGSPADIQQAG